MTSKAIPKRANMASKESKVLLPVPDLSENEPLNDLMYPYFLKTGLSTGPKDDHTWTCQHRHMEATILQDPSCRRSHRICCRVKNDPSWPEDAPRQPKAGAQGQGRPKINVHDSPTQAQGSALCNVLQRTPACIP